MTESTTAAETMQKSSASAPPGPAPVVDPRPTAAPIAVDRQSLEELMRRFPAPSSSPETLARKPNRYEDATTGPDRQISPITYVTMTKPDGTTCLVPLANVPYYEWKGYTAGEQQDIPDLPAFWADKARQQPVTETPEPVQPEQTQAPTQSPEDALKRLSGVPKTAEELEAEREAAEEERRTRFTQSAQPAPGQSGEQTGQQPLGGAPVQQPQQQDVPASETETETESGPQS